MISALCAASKVVNLTQAPGVQAFAVGPSSATSVTGWRNRNQADQTRVHSGSSSRSLQDCLNSEPCGPALKLMEEESAMKIFLRPSEHLGMSGIVRTKPVIQLPTSHPP